MYLLIHAIPTFAVHRVHGRLRRGISEWGRDRLARGSQGWPDNWIVPARGTPSR
jgi:hypothetical protein